MCRNCFRTNSPFVTNCDGLYIKSNTIRRRQITQPTASVANQKSYVYSKNKNYTLLLTFIMKPIKIFYENLAHNCPKYVRYSRSVSFLCLNNAINSKTFKQSSRDMFHFSCKPNGLPSFLLCFYCRINCLFNFFFFFSCRR